MLKKLLKKEIFEGMLKLYKTVDNNLCYWEIWDNDGKTATIHWGVVGERGKNKKISNELTAIQKEISEKIAEGYLEFDEEKTSLLEIEFVVDGFGSSKDLEKRDRLEDRLNELLGWTGLGHVDGGSIGSGTMELGCEVVDFEIAKSLIENDLKNTEFDDYSRIFDLEQE